MSLVEILDTTLRDGEQTQGVSFTPREKLRIVKSLLQKVRVDRVEVACARVSPGEERAVKKVSQWARKKRFLDKVEVAGFVDFKKSVDWIKRNGAIVLNLLTKGSLRHCIKQLRKRPEEHRHDIKKTVQYAQKQGLTVNVYLEDWSNGIRESEEYAIQLMESFKNLPVKRVYLPDTLGILSPSEVERYVRKMRENFPKVEFEFHAHNDYGLATANSLSALKAGCQGLHVTVNGLGERAGNASLDEVVTVIRDKTNFTTNVNEKSIYKISKLVERLSGKRLAENKPISGENVFTHTAGIHADGNMKAKLYRSKLNPERFGRVGGYALGKLSGKASLELNLRQLGIELTPQQKKRVLARVVQLGDRKEKVTPKDLSFIIADVLKTCGKS